VQLLLFSCSKNQPYAEQKVTGRKISLVVKEVSVLQFGKCKPSRNWLVREGKTIWMSIFGVSFPPMYKSQLFLPLCVEAVGKQMCGQ